MWRKEDKAKYSEKMQKILDASPQARTTIAMMLCDCETDEIVEVLMNINRIAGFHQKIVMMRQELARRKPEYVQMRRHDIPIEMLFDWEMTCKPFRRMYKNKREQDEKAKRNNQGLKKGMEARAFQTLY